MEVQAAPTAVRTEAIAIGQLELFPAFNRPGAGRHDRPLDVGRHIFGLACGAPQWNLPRVRSPHSPTFPAGNGPTAIAVAAPQAMTDRDMIFRAAGVAKGLYHHSHG